MNWNILMPFIIVDIVLLAVLIAVKIWNWVSPPKKKQPTGNVADNARLNRILLKHTTHTSLPWGGYSETDWRAVHEALRAAQDDDGGII